MVFCSLLGIIGLIFLTYYATKWLSKKFRSTGRNGSQSGIRIVDCIGIAADKQLIVVRAGNKAMLLGVAPGSVTKLADLDESDMLLIEEPASGDSGQGFMEVLKKAISGKNAGGDSAGNMETGDFEQEDGYGKNDNDDF